MQIAAEKLHKVIILNIVQFASVQVGHKSDFLGIEKIEVSEKTNLLFLFNSIAETKKV